MRIVVHVGPFKTGTSSIQAALAANAGALAAAGVYLPAFGQWFGRHHVRALAAPFLGGAPLAQPLPERHWHSPAEALARAEACWQQLETELAVLRPATAVLSSEFLASVPEPARLIGRLAATGGEVHVVVYVRDPVDLYVSATQQRIRSGYRFDQLPAPDDLPYGPRRVIARFARELPPGRLVVRRFHGESLVGQDVARDFLAVLAGLHPGLDPAGLALPPRRNESLPAAAVAWLLSVNAIADRATAAEARKRVVTRLAADARVQAMPRLGLDDPVLRQAVLVRKSADCRWINDRFLAGQRPLPLAGGPGGAPPTDPADLRDRMRRWLLGAGGGAGMDVIFDIALATPDAGAGAEPDPDPDPDPEDGL